MGRVLRAELPEIIGIAGDDDTVFGKRVGENSFIGGASKPDFSDMDRVEAMHRPEMTAQLRRQIFVDQEARRHSLPLGRPRGGLALA